MSRLATALLCHSPCLLDCYSNVLYLHCLQVLASAPLCHSPCWIAIHRQEILQPSRPISDPAAATTLFRSHNNNMYKAILSTAALLLLSCATAPCWIVIHRPSCISKCYFLPYAPVLTCCIIWMLMNYEAWLLLTFFCFSNYFSSWLLHFKVIRHFTALAL